MKRSKLINFPNFPKLAQRASQEGRRRSEALKQMLSEASNSKIKIPPKPGSFSIGNNPSSLDNPLVLPDPDATSWLSYVGSLINTPLYRGSRVSKLKELDPESQMQVLIAEEDVSGRLEGYASWKGSLYVLPEIDEVRSVRSIVGQQIEKADTITTGIAAQVNNKGLNTLILQPKSTALGRNIGRLVAIFDKYKNILGITVIDSTAVNPESTTSARGSSIIKKATVPELKPDELIALGDKIEVVLKSENGYKTNIEKDDRIWLVKSFWEFLNSGKSVEKLVVVNTEQCSLTNLADMYTTRTLTNIENKIEEKGRAIWTPPGVMPGDEKKVLKISREFFDKYVQTVDADYFEEKDSEGT